MYVCATSRNSRPFDTFTFLPSPLVITYLAYNVPFFGPQKYVITKFYCNLYCCSNWACCVVVLSIKQLIIIWWTHITESNIITTETAFETTKYTVNMCSLLYVYINAASSCTSVLSSQFVESCTRSTSSHDMNLLLYNLAKQNVIVHTWLILIEQ